MRLEEFDYELPADRIAQRPAERRDTARLLVLDRTTGIDEDSSFREIDRWLRPGDLLVLNDTRVVPSRLQGRKATGGRVELLLVERTGEGGGSVEWSCLASGARSLKPGTRLDFQAGLRAWVRERSGDRITVVFEADGAEVVPLVERAAAIPLPPYILRTDPVDPALAALDRERYQTVYASNPGAVAAPTAGLHFTRETFARLEARGVKTAFLTLHVGPATFQPVRAERVEDHSLGAEPVSIPTSTAEAIDRTRTSGGRIVAVGTTVVRALEQRVTPDGRVEAGVGSCDLFIRPGHRFRVVDELVTNFHLPRSTLLMLVCALAGRERVLAAYHRAIARGYRFYSYGDAMLVRSGE